MLRAWSGLAGPLRRHPARLLWPAGGVAVLAIGVLMGRILPAEDRSRPADAESRDRAQIATMDARPEARADPLIHHAVAPYLSRMEALLTLVESDRRTSPSDAAIRAWAEDLLADTRMLRDSPVREDEELRSLLDDLELVLARIVRLSSRSDAAAGPWIRESIRDRSILPRIKGTLSAGERAGGA
jgi:hypothetical protein